MYAGAIAFTNLAFASIGLGHVPSLSAVIVALAVVLFLNPMYARTQKARRPALLPPAAATSSAAVEALSDQMTTLLDLPRIVRLITDTIEDLFHPVACASSCSIPSGGSAGVSSRGEAVAALKLPADSALVRLSRGRARAGER